ncbi:MAG: 23S rRNA (guanosine(2251)-2'-O)-methyltransferase RlmB [Acidobacteria bacterium]|nr:23S rRNA (guanosine(2251)-2'-O)-methyltransferase RlmB [Acidobacteriota bacterium]MBE3125337.1 23S rRNA (guanosine(2251)-2'-O)-methyltransferase RlmB [Acidobacteriota bacterium]MBE3130329.1 23S rRNA (guanosine(2251)-2'-O)-methyltransferase RlmB [Acidobacteriota bacterium]
MTGESAMDRIIRINPLLEALKSASGRVNKVFIQEEKGHARIGEVIREAKARGVPCVFVPARRLDQVAPGHQGVMAEVSPKGYASLEEILARSPKPFVVLLDEVEDPQNLGAIVRSAEGAGADGLILPERRSAGLTETVDTVSAGALEHLLVARVTNLVRAMEELKGKGLWLVGAEGSGDEPWYSFDFTGPIGIVLGSEGKGLRPLVRKTCDKVLAIPLAGKVGSLNVAAAAAVFFFEVVRQRRSAA